MSKRPLVPSFIQKLDDKLLRNKPGAWAARTHLVLSFSIVFALILFTFCYLVFFDAKQYSSVGSWQTFVGLIAFVGFVFWLIFLFRFNMFKRYGNWSALDGLLDFTLYFISIGALVAVCFIPSAVETMRANQQFGNEEIVKDINELNINACKLEYGLLPMTWDADTFKIVNKINDDPVSVNAPVPDGIEYDEVVTVQYVGPRYHMIDTAQLSEKLNNADSLLKINDTLYVFYESPDYRFIRSYSADDYSTVKLVSSADIYNRILKFYQKPDRAALQKRMQELQIKYAVSNPYYYSNYYELNENATYDAKIKKKFDLGSINNGIDNIVKKKYEWVTDWKIYLRFFYYITLLTTLLVFIFRHSTAKTFFLSALTVVLLTIISGLLLVMSMGDEVSSMFSFMIAYYIVFVVLAFSIFASKVWLAVQGIGLNLFLFMTPFMPLICVALYETTKTSRYYNKGIYTQQPDNSALYYLLAEIAGSVILVVLIQPVFKRLYRKWYSAPEE